MKIKDLCIKISFFQVLLTYTPLLNHGVFTAKGVRMRALSSDPHLTPSGQIQHQQSRWRRKDASDEGGFGQG